MLTRVLYISSVAPGVTSSDVERLVASSRRRNRQLDITGALVVCSVRFAQVLEGREDAIEEMLAKIAKDPRHTNMKLLARFAIEKRLCDSWDMAFVDDESWGATLDGVANETVSPAEFFRTLLDHYEKNRSRLF